MRFSPISELENLWKSNDSTLPLRVSLCGPGLGKRPGLRSLKLGWAAVTKPWPWMRSRPSHQAVLPAGSCGPPCRPTEVPAITLPREVSLALWWRMLVKIAAALAETWDVGGRALASWLAGAASCFSLRGSMDFMSANTCAWHSIGNRCRKGYEGTHKFRSIAYSQFGVGWDSFTQVPT